MTLWGQLDFDLLFLLLLLLLLSLFAFCFWLAGVATVRLFLRWHPRDVSVLHALPLCGAAPTFLCRRKEK
jgi:hypothetical protein